MLRWKSILALFIIALGACASKTATVAPSLKVGVGEAVITPSEPTRMRGFARAQISTGVHDDLHARSLLVEDGNGDAAVLMTVALCGMSEDYLKAIREGITAKTGIKPENIVVSCTHTHSGPNVGATPSTFNKEEVEASIASLAYRTWLVEQCVASAVQAWETRVPGRIGIASTKVLELGRNRRRLLYGGLHPDPEVAVIKVEDARGKLLGVAFNYGCHPSGIDWHNTLFTEDWPYYAIQGIKKKVGQDVWVAFYQSAEGDIGVGYSAELSAVGVDMPVRTYWYIEHKGNQMAGAVLDALPGHRDVGAMRMSGWTPPASTIRCARNIRSRSRRRSAKSRTRKRGSPNSRRSRNSARRAGPTRCAWRCSRRNRSSGPPSVFFGD